MTTISYDDLYHAYDALRTQTEQLEKHLQEAIALKQQIPNIKVDIEFWKGAVKRAQERTDRFEAAMKAQCAKENRA